MTNRSYPGTRAGWRGGFTLTEILISSGLAVVLLGVVLGVMGVGSDGYSRTSARVDANVEARTALRTLAEDVSALRFDESFGVRPVPGVRRMNEIWFSSWKPRQAQESTKASGDLCFVYYYTAITRPLEGVTGPFSRKLYRRFVSSADVMAKRKAGETMGLPDPDPAALGDEAIAFNIVQFLAEPLIRDDEGVDQRWTEGDPVPTHLRLTLRVTDNKTAGALTDPDDWEGKSALAKQLLGTGEVENKRVRTFRMTVPLDR